MRTTCSDFLVDASHARTTGTHLRETKAKRRRVQEKASKTVGCVARETEREREKTVRLGLFETGVRLKLHDVCMLYNSTTLYVRTYPKGGWLSRVSDSLKAATGKALVHCCCSTWPQNQFANNFSYETFQIFVLTY